MQPLFKMIIRLPKEEANFFYFILEANENLCFYSTTDESLTEGYREIELIGTNDFHHEILALIENLKKHLSVTIIEQEIVSDGQLLKNIT